MLKKLFLIFMLAICLPVFASEQPPIFNSPKNKIIVSQKNPEFTITLQSNPTTGFVWKLISYDKNLVTFINRKYIAPKNKKLLGAPGYEIWTFQAKKANYRVNQVGHIRMEYKRPWTKEGETKKNFIIIVKSLIQCSLISLQCNK